MLDVSSSGKEGEESTFEEKGEEGGQQGGLNGSLSGGNAVHSISAAAANFISPRRHLQPIQKLGNGESCKFQIPFLTETPHDDKRR